MGEDPGDTTFSDTTFLISIPDEVKQYLDDLFLKIPEMIFDYMIDKLTSFFNRLTTTIKTAHETLHDFFTDILMPVAYDVGVSSGNTAQIEGAISIILYAIYCFIAYLIIRIYRLVLDLVPVI